MVMAMGMAMVMAMVMVMVMVMVVVTIIVMVNALFMVMVSDYCDHDNDHANFDIDSSDYGSDCVCHVMMALSDFRMFLRYRWTLRAPRLSARRPSLQTTSKAASAPLSKVMSRG